MTNLGLEATLPTFKPADELVSKPLVQAYGAWKTLARGRIAPTRAEISPARFKPVLADVFILDVIDGGADFRFALGGDRILRFLKDRLTAGMLLSEVAGSEFHTRTMRFMRHCVDTKAPVAAGPSLAALEGREFLTVENLVMPISNDGVTVTNIIGAIHIMPNRPGEIPVGTHETMPPAFPVEAPAAE
jgi:hypothetical protein